MRLLTIAFGIMAVAGTIAVSPSAQALPMSCYLAPAGTPGCEDDTCQWAHSPVVDDNVTYLRCKSGTGPATLDEWWKAHCVGGTECPNAHKP